MFSFAAKAMTTRSVQMCAASSCRSNWNDQAMTKTVQVETPDAPETMGGLRYRLPASILNN